MAEYSGSAEGAAYDAAASSAERAEVESAMDALNPERDPIDDEDPVATEEGLTEVQAEELQEAVADPDETIDHEEEPAGKRHAIDYAAANGNFDEDSDLSDLDEEQFKDFDGAAPNEEEPAVYNLPSFRKKTGGTKTSKKPINKARRGSNSDDDLGKIYSDDESKPRKGLGPRSKVPPKPEDPEELRKWELDRAMDAAIAPTKKRRKKDEDDLVASMDDEIVQLTERMRLAAQADAEANAAKRPARTKLQLLPEVQRILRSEALYDSILDNNMLVSMKHWLEPLPDRSLPGLNIQKTIFDALEALPIKTEHLRESGVGKVVLFYQISKKPEDFIKVQANALIDKWTRPITRKSASHKTKRFKTAEFDGFSTVPRLSGSLSQQTEVSGYKSKGGTSIPRGERAYEVAPRAREIIGLQSSSNGGEAYKRMKNTLKDLGKRNGKKGGVSIEGRGIA